MLKALFWLWTLSSNVSFCFNILEKKENVLWLFWGTRKRAKTANEYIEHAACYACSLPSRYIRSGHLRWIYTQCPNLFEQCLTL